MTAPPRSLGADCAGWARTRPDAPAVTCGGETLTWRTFHRQSNRMARALAGRGVTFGDLVSIALPNGTGYMLAAFALWKLGATPQPVAHKAAPAELAATVDLAQSPLVIAEAISGLRQPVVSPAQLLAGADDDRDLPDVLAPSFKAPTSGGSTGRPKLIVAIQPGAVEPSNLAFWRVGDSDVALMPGPLYHNAPFTSSATALAGGAHLVILPKFDPAAFIDAVERHRATWTYVVPTMMNRVWRLPEDVRRRERMASLRTVWHMAAPCPPWLKQAWIDWLGADAIWEVYGGTEGQAGCVIGGGEWLTHRGSVGRVAHGCMKVVDTDGRDLPPGETGEVFMKRAEGMPPSYRYIGAEARSRDGWDSLGDMGWFDAEGYLYLADRRTDMILVGGENVYPAEVEGALDLHPLILSSAVIGLPDDDLGARIHAIVQAPATLDVADVQAHLARHLAPYKRPRSFEIVAAPLRDDAGKVRRYQLRQERLAARRTGA